MMNTQYKIIQKTKLIALLVLLVPTIFACEQEYEVYSGGNYIQFGSAESYIYKSNFQYQDTTKNFTFVYESAEVLKDTLYFDLYAMGGAKDYARPFVLEQEQVGDTLNCVPGLHYVGFEEEEMKKLHVIKAGEVHLLVPIILLRDESLETGTYKLKIRLKANEHFELGDSSLSWRMAFVTDELLCPDEWQLMVKMLGKYSKVKHRFLIDVTGLKWDSALLASFRRDLGAMYYWKSYCMNKINEYNKVHPDNPLTDEDGELVSM